MAFNPIPYEEGEKKAFAPIPIEDDKGFTPVPYDEAPAKPAIDPKIAAWGGGDPAGLALGQFDGKAVAKDVLVDSPKQIIPGLGRGVYSIGAAAGSMTEAFGDWVDAQEDQWKRVYYNSPLGKKALDRKQKKYIEEHGTILPQELKAVPDSVGDKISAHGRKRHDEYNEHPEWMERKEEIYGGTFSENPSLARVVGSASESAPTMLGALALSYAGMPNAGAALLAGTEAAPIYTEAKRMGASESDALYYALLSGIGTAALERVGLDALTGKIPVVDKLIDKMGKNWVAGAMVNFGTEGTQETLQTIYQNAVALGYDGDRELLEGALEAGLVGGLMGSTAGGARQIMSDYMGKLAENGESVQDDGPVVEQPAEPRVSNAERRRNRRRTTAMPTEQTPLDLDELDETSRAEIDKLNGKTTPAATQEEDAPRPTANDEAAPISDPRQSNAQRRRERKKNRTAPDAENTYEQPLSAEQPIGQAAPSNEKAEVSSPPSADTAQPAKVDAVQPDSIAATSGPTNPTTPPAGQETDRPTGKKSLPVENEAAPTRDGDIVKTEDLPEQVQKDARDVGGKDGEAWQYQELSVDELYNNSMANMLEDTDRDGYNKNALIEDVKANGVKSPIAVIKGEDGFYDAEGQHRIYAAKQAGLKTIPAYVKQSSSDSPNAKNDPQPDLSRTDDSQPAKKKTYYHGTNTPFAKLSKKRARKSMLWFSDDSGHANKFVAGGRRNMGAKARKGSAIHPVHLDISNPLDLKDIEVGTNVSMADVLNRAGVKDVPAKIREIAQEALSSGYAGVSSQINDPVGYLVDKYTSGGRINDLLDNPILVKVLEVAGFDSIEISEDGAVNTAVFDDSKIESVFGGQPRYHTIKEAMEATGAMRKDIEGTRGNYTVRGSDIDTKPKKEQNNADEVQETKDSDSGTDRGKGKDQSRDSGVDAPNPQKAKRKRPFKKLSETRADLTLQFNEDKELMRLYERELAEGRYNKANSEKIKKAMADVGYTPTLTSNADIANPPKKKRPKTAKQQAAWDEIQRRKRLVDEKLQQFRDDHPTIRIPHPGDKNRGIPRDPLRLEIFGDKNHPGAAPRGKFKSGQKHQTADQIVEEAKRLIPHIVTPDMGIAEAIKAIYGPAETVGQKEDAAVSDTGADREASEFAYHDMLDTIKAGYMPSFDEQNQSPKEYADALKDSGVDPDSLKPVDYPEEIYEELAEIAAAHDEVLKNENTDALEDWKKKNGIQDPDEQGEMFGKGAVGDVFELRSETVKKTETTTEKEERVEKEREAEKNQGSFLDNLEAEARAEIETLKKKSMGLNAPAGIAANYVVIGAVKLARGTVKFSKWSAEMVAEFGDSVKPHLLNIYKAAQKVALTNHKDQESFVEAATLAAANAGMEISPSEDTGIKNESVNEQRAERDLPPLPDSIPETNEEQWQEAMDRIRANPNEALEIMADIQANPRVLNPVESMILLQHETDLRNQSNKAAAAVVEAFESGDTAEVDRRQLLAQRISDELTELEQVAKIAGSEWGKAGQARQRLMKQDFTLAAMETRARAAKGGEPLTPKETADLKKIADEHAAKVKELEQKLKEAEERQREREVQESFDSITKQAEKDTKGLPNKYILQKAEQLISRWDKKADASREALRKMNARTNDITSMMDPTRLYHLAVIGRSHLGHIGLNFAKWSQAMIDDIGEMSDEHLKQVYDESQKMVDEDIEKLNTAPKVKKAVKRKAAKVGSQENIDEVTEKIEDRVSKGEETQISALVQKLAKAFVAEGIETNNRLSREQLIDKVHEVLEDIIPGMSRRDTMDAISGYGKYSLLSKDEISEELRKLKGEMQQLGKLDDMQNGQAPKKTGVERRKVEDEERRLIKLVNEAKRKGGFTITDPESQLRTTMQAIKKRLANDIADLERQIATKQKDVKEKSSIEYDAEAKELQKRRDELKKEFDSIFGKSELTDKQRVKMAIKAAERSAAELERRINEGDLFPGKKESKTPETPELKRARAKRDRLKAQLKAEQDKARPKKSQEQIRLEAALKSAERSLQEYERRIRENDLFPKKKAPKTKETPELKAARAKRDAAKEELKQLQLLAKPKKSKEEIANQAYRTRVKNRIAEMERRMAENDYIREKRQPLKLDKKSTDAQYELEQVKERFLKAEMKWKLKNRTKMQKVLGFVQEVKLTSKSILTSFDFSAIRRQGGILAINHPILSLKQVPKMLLSATSSKWENYYIEKMKAGKNYQLAKRVKLFISEKDGALSEMEEAYMSRHADIPIMVPVGKGRKIDVNPVAASQRAYTTFLNAQRMAVFDALVATLGKYGAVTDFEAQKIAEFINEASGHGKIGAKTGLSDKKIVGLNGIYFAPSLVASRFNVLFGRPLIQGSGGTLKTRMLVAQEYARFLVGMGIVYALATNFWDDDGEVEWDPRSSQFARTRINDTRFEFLSGLQQVIVFTTRLITGETKTAKGEVKPLREKYRPLNLFRDKPNNDPVGYGQKTAGDEIWRFNRTKLAPWPGNLVNLAVGKDVVGNDFTLEDLPAAMVTPMAPSDTIAALQDLGLSKGTIAGLFVTLGDGVLTYEDHKPESKPTKRPKYGPRRPSKKRPSRPSR